MSSCNAKKVFKTVICWSDLRSLNGSLDVVEAQIHLRNISKVGEFAEFDSCGFLVPVWLKSSNSSHEDVH